ncbi:MAG: hypothetical protein O7C65_04680 [Planctomycetota bacterium]|nr:hypothetical protein [Planctomycetota bacterium]MCZ6735065.1 hypothetical protein [Planctomycetota bacterium]
MSDKSPDNRDTLQGLACDASNPHELRRALDEALDYRGDVTITRKSTGESIQGYVFDRTSAATLSDSKIRIIPTNGGQRVTIPYDDIAQVRFSGKDTAAGRSFETWMKKYVRNKLAGEAANIEPESLDDA